MHIMFSPNRKAEAPSSQNGLDTPHPTSGRSNGNSSAAQLGNVLSSGVEITGSIKFTHEFLMDGELKGKIDSTGRLVVGKNGKVRGEITTRSVTVHGTVDGNISVTERCDLRSGCTLRGDIEAPRLVVDEDATFIGNAKIASNGAANRTDDFAEAEPVLQQDLLS